MVVGAACCWLVCGGRRRVGRPRRRLAAARHGPSRPRNPRPERHRRAQAVQRRHPGGEEPRYDRRTAEEGSRRRRWRQGARQDRSVGSVRGADGRGGRQTPAQVRQRGQPCRLQVERTTMTGVGRLADRWTVNRRLAGPRRDIHGWTGTERKLRRDDLGPWDGGERRPRRQ